MLNDKNEIPEKINPKTNVFNFLPRILKQIFSRIRYGSVYFFDTNAIMLLKNVDDGRIKNWIGGIRDYKITETIDKEVKEKESLGYSKKNKNKISILTFEGLRIRWSSTCVLYYNYISCMYNPAILDNPTFLTELLLGNKMRGNDLNKAQQETYDFLINKFQQGAKNEENIFLEKKSDLERHIDNSAVNAIRKKNKAINKPYENKANDFKNLSLILLYCLLEKKNTTLITSDSDYIAALLDWEEAVSQQLCFKQIVLEYIGNLSDDDKKEFYKGRRLMIFVNWEEFYKKFHGIRQDLLAHGWKKSYFSFKLKYWDKEKKKYFNGISVSFNNVCRENLINLHQNLTCPLVRNVDMGNYFSYLFWPLMPKNKYFKISVKIKDLVKYNQNVPWYVHEGICKYVKEDKNGKIDNFSQFRV
jgi:hypothetical protein